MNNKFKIIIADIGYITEIYDAKLKENPENKYLYGHKQNRINDVLNGTKLCFYGLLNDEPITEATAVISPMDATTQNKEKILNSKTAYLCAFETKELYRGQGYFSALYRFMEDTLKNMGFEYLTLGAEPHETKNKTIYRKWGYSELIYIGIEEFDGLRIDVEYYRKKL